MRVWPFVLDASYLRRQLTFCTAYASSSCLIQVATLRLNGPNVGVVNPCCETPTTTDTLGKGRAVFISCNCL